MRESRAASADEVREVQQIVDRALASAAGARLRRERIAASREQCAAFGRRLASQGAALRVRRAELRAAGLRRQWRVLGREGDAGVR